jgi:CRISPR-associated protein (TIGR03986 family)
MAEQKLIQGVLAVTAKKAVRLKFNNAAGRPLDIAAAPDQLSAELSRLSSTDVKKLDGLTVEFELDGPNKAVQIREAGKPWEAPAAARAAADQRGRGNRPGGQRPGGQRPGPPRQFEDRGPRTQDRERPPRTRLEVGFHHAYNFIPTPPRRPDAPEPMRDGRPAGHHRYHVGLFSGWIEVTLKTVTPLLIPDASRAVEVQDSPGHFSFPLRTGPDGRPYLPPTSVKGMLRTAFEAVTHSRLGVFAGHEAPLAYRMPARDGLKMVPAVVEQGRIRILTGTAQLNSGQRQPVYGAWLHKYAGDAPSWKGLDKHGQAVWAYVTLWQHRNFQFWNVVELQPFSSAPPGHEPTDRRRGGRAQPVRPVQGMWVAGYVCITGQNIDRKHDERVFFTVDPDPPQTAVTKRHREQWEHLITNYQEIHAEEIRKGKNGPPALKRSRWSRHVVGGSAEADFGNGTLCYAEVTYQAGRLTVHQVYPVNISRKLFETSPQQLLEGTGLLPAGSIDELSPADRVFGWVHQQGRGAFRGNLRIGSVRCEATADAAIEDFGQPGVPLAILGAAKPQQARFYVAKSPAGEAQEDGLPADRAGFAQGKGLRGIKVYPHHHGPPDDEASGYWADALNDRTAPSQVGWCREYRRPEPTNGDAKLRDDQNRSIQAWVRPETEFTFRIHVTNLSPFELGALLWLLSLEPHQYHRLGGGKPLGFGSVHLTVTQADLRDGQAWKAYYESLLDEDTSTGQRISMREANDDTGRRAMEEMISGFQRTLSEAHRGADFGQIPTIAAFLRAAEGFADKRPVHYPRVQQANGSTAPDPAGENFHWFGENERPQGQQLALPDLADERLLPYYEHESPGGRGR